MLKKDIYTVEEVSKLFQVSHSSIYDLIKSKKLTAIKINSIYRILNDDLQKYIKENKTKNWLEVKNGKIIFIYGRKTKKR